MRQLCESRAKLFQVFYWSVFKIERRKGLLRGGAGFGAGAGGTLILCYCYVVSRLVDDHKYQLRSYSVRRRASRNMNLKD